MAEHKQFRIKSTRVTGRATGTRETFRIAASMPQRQHGTERALEDAEKIFQSLVQSGRLPPRKK
jgi:predicted RNA-binding protein (virulence factor B family)